MTHFASREMWRKIDWTNKNNVCARNNIFREELSLAMAYFFQKKGGISTVESSLFCNATHHLSSFESEKMLILYFVSAAAYPSVHFLLNILGFWLMDCFGSSGHAKNAKWVYFPPIFYIDEFLLSEKKIFPFSISSFTYVCELEANSQFVTLPWIVFFLNHDFCFIFKKLSSEYT